MALLLWGVLGIFLIVGKLKKTQELLLTESDQHQLDIAHSVDLGVDNILRGVTYTMDVFCARQSVRQAEQDWHDSGDVSFLSDTMTAALVDGNEFIDMMFVRDGDRTLFCTECGDECSFTVFGSTSTRCNLCQSEEGEYYLAVRHDSTDGALRYYALVRLETLFLKTVDTHIIDSYWFAFYEPENDIYIHNEDETPNVRHIFRQEIEARKDGLAALYRLTKGGTAGFMDYYGVYRYGDSDYAGSHRIAVLPRSETTNGVFSVGVSVNADRLISPIRTDVTQNALLCVVSIVCFALAAVLTALEYVRTVDMKRELEQIREKNRAISELLDKSSELAHQQRLALLGTLSSSVAHEFNNLLTPIMGYSMMLINDLPEEDESQDALAEIYETSLRAKELVSRIGVLSRKTQPADLSMLVPDELLKEALSFSSTARPHGVELMESYGCPEPCIYAGRIGAVQILMNIIMNAYQAMSAEGGTLKCSTSVEGGTVSFRFSDTGPGMSSEVLERIFDPFFTTKSTGKGTGLGMAVAKGLAESYGARIEIRSELGKGTDLTVTFPRREEAPAEE